MCLSWTESFVSVGLPEATTGSLLEEFNHCLSPYYSGSASLILASCKHAVPKQKHN